MSHASRVRAVAFVVAGVVGLTSESRAANLVHNPTFNGGIAPWTSQGGNGTIAFDPLDAAGAAGSGSVKVTSTFGDGQDSVAQQCITVDPNVHYRFRADLLYPTGQAPADAFAFLQRYATTNCTGPLVINNSVELADSVPPRDTWQRIENGNAFVNNSATRSVILYLGLSQGGSNPGQVVAYFDNVVFEPGTATGSCVPNGGTVCLNDYRFQVDVNWETSTASGNAHAVQLASDSGAFTFFSPDNIEIQIKSVNACTFNHRFWIFSSGTTDVGATITVTDTKTSTVKTYFNALKHPFTPILDTDAFATCP